MTRLDLAEAVRNKTGMTTPQASEVVESLLEAMLHRLEQREESEGVRIAAQEP